MAAAGSDQADTVGAVRRMAGGCGRSGAPASRAMQPPKQGPPRPSRPTCGRAARLIISYPYTTGHQLSLLIQMRCRAVLELIVLQNRATQPTHQQAIHFLYIIVKLLLAVGADVHVRGHAVKCRDRLRTLGTVSNASQSP